MRVHPRDHGSGHASITIEHERGGRRVLCLSGEVDTAAVAEFYAVHGTAPLVVDQIDAGTVTFISSTGLAVLLRCATESGAAGRHPLLRACSRPVERLLKMSGVGSLFPRPDPANDPSGDSKPQGV
jgi:anti-anti-sigma factor